MSRYTLGRVPCPHCRWANRHRLAQSVNAARHPEVVAQLLEGSFQRFRCARCARDYEVDGPFTLSDLDAGYVIGVLPGAWEESWDRWEGVTSAAFQRVTGAAAGSLAEALCEGVRVRTVFGFAQAREKLVAMQAGLDDGILETLKLRLIRAMGLPLTAEGRPRLEALEGDALIFVTQGEEGPRSFEVGRALYHEIAADPGPWSGALDALQAGPYVDLGRLLIAAEAPRPSPLA